MSWNEEKSRRRILSLLGSVPAADVRVEDFGTSYRQRLAVEASLGKARPGGQSIEAIPYNATVLTDGVHVYAKLIDYDVYLEDIGRESEAGSALLLEFVHLHYSGLDRLIEAFGAQRVDHHGGRVHAVVLEPVGDDKEEERILAALSLAAAMRELVGEASAAHQRKFGSRIRVGVESGKALALNSGRSGEAEPLFLGDAANIAAKLTDEEGEGVAVGPRARAVLGIGRRVRLDERHFVMDEASFVPRAGRSALTASTIREERVESAFRDFRAAELADAVTPARFAFFRHALPLSDLDFGGLSPARSARQESVSIFADLSGFTAYVHRSIVNGEIQRLVSTLHVLRGEMAAVLRDFGGRKVRFIGDCIHGVLAEGTQAYTQEMDSIRQAVQCAGALRSSFELCQTMLPGIADLGLKIGIEWGATPVTRLGIRGARSVRCASSKAVSVAERVQRDCDKDETRLGASALGKAPAAIRKAFGLEGRLDGLDYLAATAFAVAFAAPAVARAEPVAAESHAR